MISEESCQHRKQKSVILNCNTISQSCSQFYCIFEISFKNIFQNLTNRELLSIKKHTFSKVARRTWECPKCSAQHKHEQIYLDLLPYIQYIFLYNIHIYYKISNYIKLTISLVHYCLYNHGVDVFIRVKQKLCNNKPHYQDYQSALRTCIMNCSIISLTRQMNSVWPILTSL